MNKVASTIAKSSKKILIRPSYFCFANTDYQPKTSHSNEVPFHFIQPSLFVNHFSGSILMMHQNPQLITAEKEAAQETLKFLQNIFPEITNPEEIKEIKDVASKAAQEELKLAMEVNSKQLKVEGMLKEHFDKFQEVPNFELTIVWDAEEKQFVGITGEGNEFVIPSSPGGSDSGPDFEYIRMLFHVITSVIFVVQLLGFTIDIKDNIQTLVSELCVAIMHTGDLIAASLELKKAMEKGTLSDKGCAIVDVIIAAYKAGVLWIVVKGVFNILLKKLSSDGWDKALILKLLAEIFATIYASVETEGKTLKVKVISAMEHVTSLKRNFEILSTVFIQN